MKKNLELKMLDEPSHQVGIGLNKIALVLKQHTWEQTGPRGLNPTQSQVLVALARELSRELNREAKEGLTITELVERLAITQPTVSDSVQSLVKKGFVTKCPSPSDRRIVYISLTEMGRAEAEQLTQWPDFLIEAIDSLSEEEQAVLARSLVKMVRSLHEAGKIPVAKMCVTCQFFQPNIYDDSRKPHHCLYMDTPFGDVQLRTECAEYEGADATQRDILWRAFTTKISK
jgi:DNA-binding MarR family transcriptional regulator